MPKLLFKQVKIIDSNSAHHLQIKDVIIENDTISYIGNEVNTSSNDFYKIVSGGYLTTAFFDTQCHSSVPGYEYRETFESLCSVAMAGGFGSVALLPDSKPVRQSGSDIEFVRNQQYPVKFYPLGAIHHQMNEADLNEMYDMHKCGAIGFSNANKAIKEAGTMGRAMQYAKNFDAVIYSFCHDDGIIPGAMLAEGTVAVSMGLKGIPPMSEYLMIMREIELAEYFQVPIHISKISCEKSVELIRNAKQQGISITASVAVMNLALTDEALLDFDSNLKLMPPLRQANDAKALWQGIADGTIDAICSDHHPLEIEKKNVEFDYAAFGNISLQIALPIAIEGRNRFAPNVQDEVLIEKFNTGATKVFKNISLPSITEGNKTHLTWIQTDEQTILTPKSNHSLSNNTYYMNKPLPYKIGGTILGNQYFFNP